MFKKILVPTDGSEMAEKAADAAIELAGRLGSSIVFLSVVDEISPAFAYELESGASLDVAELDRQRTKFSQSAVDRLKEKGDAAGISSETMVVSGHPWETILDTVEKVGADSIVMGSHGRRALAAAMLGNVTFNVIHGAKVPVAVIPREARPA